MMWLPFFNNLLFGISLTALGLWWGMNTLDSYYTCRAKQVHFTNKPFYYEGNGKWPETVSKLLPLTIYIWMEMITGPCKNGEISFHSFPSALLALTLLFQGGLVIILHFLNQGPPRIFLYLTMVGHIYLHNLILPDYNQSYWDHLGQMILPVNALFHSTSVVLMVVAILEARFSNSLLLPVMRSISMMVIGLWLVTVAIFYNDFELVKDLSCKSVAMAIALFSCVVFMASGTISMVAMKFYTDYNNVIGEGCKYAIRELSLAESGFGSLAEFVRSLVNNADRKNIKVYKIPMRC